MMNNSVSRGLWFTLCVGGLWVAGTAAANAAEPSTGTDGIASGSQAVVGVTLPVTVSGNGISLLGDATSSAASTTTTPAPAPAVTVSTSALGGVLSGDHALVSVAVPVTVTGNAVSVVADATQSGATTETGGPAAPPQPVSSTVTGGIASGLQVPVDIAVPVAVGGNAVSVFGDSSSMDSTAATTVGAPGTTVSSGVGGLLSGVQLPVDVAVPVAVGGNAVSVFGDSSSAGAVTAADAGEPEGVTSSGSSGLLSGVQLPVDVSVPVTAGGNALSVLGDASSDTATTTTTAGTGGAVIGSGGGLLGGDVLGGLVDGLQLPIDVGVPVTVGGNAISVLGDASTGGSTTTTPGDPGTPATPGTPETPGSPETPGTSETPGTTSTTPAGRSAGTGVSTTGGTAVAALGRADLGGAVLASTGSDELGVGALAALLGLLGVLALSAAANRRRHGTR